jgi:kynurenine formamidase
LKKLGIENVPAIATRGVRLDMAGLLGSDPVKEGTAFNRAEIDNAIKRYNAGEPGLGVEGAKYLASLGVAMVGADTWGLEVLPFEKNAGVFEVHQILLPLNGIYILENIHTEEMVKDRAWEFLFTLGPSRITGAVQAIINPIAIK